MLSDVLLLADVLLFVRYRWKRAWQLVVVVLVSYVLKYTFNVPRAHALSPAFPSTHSALAYFIACSVRQWWAVLLTVVAPLRVCESMHSVWDVLGGGVLALILCAGLESNKFKNILSILFRTV